MKNLITQELTRISSLMSWKSSTVISSHSFTVALLVCAVVGLISLLYIQMCVILKFGTSIQCCLYVITLILKLYKIFHKDFFKSRDIMYSYMLT